MENSNVVFSVVVDTKLCMTILRVGDEFYTYEASGSFDEIKSFITYNYTGMDLFKRMLLLLKVKNNVTDIGTLTLNEVKEVFKISLINKLVEIVNALLKLPLEEHHESLQDIVGFSFDFNTHFFNILVYEKQILLDSLYLDRYLKGFIHFNEVNSFIKLFKLYKEKILVNDILKDNLLEAASKNENCEILEFLIKELDN